jgi:uncharacterized OsmC-like protein
VNIDASEAIGGSNNGARPMELVLMGLGGCSAIDIISILRKQKQIIEDYEIEINAERYESRTPSIFKKIKVTHILSGEIKEKKLVRAINLSVTKYCSVSHILNPTAEIEYYYKLNSNEIIKMEKNDG